MKNDVRTVRCPPRIGIVAAITVFLAKNGCHITDSAQFDDETTSFFMRITLRSEAGATVEELGEGFAGTAREFGMAFTFHDATHRTRVPLMVSNLGHCLNDLLYRWRIGAAGRHRRDRVEPHDLPGLIVNHDIPFHHVKVRARRSPKPKRG